MMTRLKTLLHSFTIWLNSLLLLAYPFADSIIAALRDNLPDLAQYLPANVFRAVGLALVVYNIVHATRAANKKAKEIDHAA